MGEAWGHAPSQPSWMYHHLTFLSKPSSQIIIYNINTVTIFIDSRVNWLDVAIMYKIMFLHLIIDTLLTRDRKCRILPIHNKLILIRYVLTEFSGIYTWDMAEWGPNMFARRWPFFWMANCRDYFHIGYMFRICTKTQGSICGFVECFHVLITQGGYHLLGLIKND